MNWPTDLSFHSLRADLTAVGSSVKIDFFMDNQHKATQYGANFVGKPLALYVSISVIAYFVSDRFASFHYSIINLQVILQYRIYVFVILKYELLTDGR